MQNESDAEWDHCCIFSDVMCITDLHFDTDICLIFFLSQKSVFVVVVFAFCSVLNVLFMTDFSLSYLHYKGGLFFYYL